MATVLVTGANGFVGKRLILNLLDQGHVVYALCRIKGIPSFEETYENLHYLWGDLNNEEVVKNFPQEIDAAYYLVHSMTERGENLSEQESKVAKNFLKAIKNTRIQQIIYLGGIIADEKQLSPHLASRLLVENILRESNVPLTVLRSSIIIGAGSASFEIIRDLSEKLPIMIAPKWVKTKCQPIAIADVLFYLVNVLLNPKCYGRVFDIGGPEVMTFKDLLLNYAKFRNLKRFIFDVPVLTPHLSSYWLVFITSVKFSLCFYLVESMRYSSTVGDHAIEKIIPHTCLSYRESLSLALQKIAQNEVVSSWMDAWELRGDNPSVDEYVEVPQEGCLKDQRRVKIEDSLEKTVKRIWSIGGNVGYYAFNWAWHLRGFIDQMIGGVGFNRGRRDPLDIRVGDSIDFWRVVLAEKDKGHLILLAGMKVPGEAWLEFKIEEEQEAHYLIQTATFRPKGVFGRLYWYFLFPIHVFIFQRMANAIAGK